MSSIDERIVDMKFNSAGFDSGVSKAIGFLDKLKASLKLDGATKGIDDVDAAGKRFSLDGIAKGVEGIAGKFSAMSVLAITALANIANKAVNVGLDLAKSLTVAPIMDGFAEYELKMGSIQTILANTARHGTGLKQVTSSLDELNEYADKTIYNFGDMTKNIGLFTNAGIKVEDATSMIKGFSNEAAASGTTSQGAAGAAYQLSQALSAGTIRLMDWRSLTNVGMGNKNMQTGIIEIAEAMGEFTGSGTDATAAAKDFNGSLEKGWLSAEVMTNYLKIQAGELSDEQMRNLKLSDEQIQKFKKQQKTSEEAATKVRTWTQLIGTLQEGVGSSWAQTFDILFGDFNQATELFTAVSDTLGTMIGASGDARNKLLESWASLGGRDSAIGALKNAFTALMGVINPIMEAFKEIFPPMTAERLFQITEAVRKFSEKLILSEKSSENLKRTFKGVFAIFDIVWMVIKGVVGVIGDLIGVVAGGTGGFLGFTGTIGDFIVKVRDAIKEGNGIATIFSLIGSVLKVPLVLIGAMAKAIGSLFTGLGEIDLSGFTDGFGKIVADSKPLQKAGEVVSKIWEKVKTIFEGIKAAFAPAIDWLSEAMLNVGKAISDSLTNLDFGGILTLINGGLLGGILLAIKKFVGKLTDVVPSGGEGFGAKLKGMFDGVTGSLEAMQAKLKAEALIKIAIAVGILSVSVIALSLVDPARLASAMAAITAMFVQLLGAMKIMEAISTTKGAAKMPFIAAGLILLSVAILVLSAAVAVMSTLDWNELAKGLTGVTVLIGLLVLAGNNLEKAAPGMIKSGAAMILLAFAVKILASAVTDLSGLSWEDLAKGLTGVGVLLGALLLFTKFAETNKGGLAQAAGLVLLGAAIKILASAVSDFASLSVNEIIKGLGSVTLILAALAAFTKVAGGAKSMIGVSVGMVILGAAIKIIASAVGDLGSMSIEKLVKGLIGLAGSLVIIAGAMHLMPKNMLMSAISLIAVAAALKIIASAMLDFGGMSWEEIGKSMVMLAGSLVILAAAMWIMNGAIVGAAALIIAAAAIALLVPPMIALSMLSWDQIGAGLGALAATLGILAAAGILLIPALPGLLLLGVALALIGTGVMLAGTGLLNFALGLTALSAASVVGAAAITAFVTAILDLIPLAMQKLGEGIIAFAGVIAGAGPEMTAAMVTFLMSILNAIDTLAPKIVDTLMRLLFLMVETLVKAIPRLVDAGLRLVTGILNGIAQNITKIVEAGTNIIVNFINGISKALPRIIQAAANLIINFVNGLANAIRNNTERMNAAGRNLADAIVDGMVSGITNGIETVKRAAMKIASGALSAAKNFLGIKSPSREFRKIGAWSAEGMAIGITKTSGMVELAAENMGSSALDGVKDGISGIGELALSELDADPTIRPVLDLSAVRAEGSRLGSLLDAPSLDLSATSSSALAAANGYSDNVKAKDDNPEALGSTEIIFQQTNNSPKSISAVETYRNTKNLLSVAKEALGS